MAKRLGVTDQQLAELGHSESNLLDEREKAALRFAEQMTINARPIPEALFEQLRGHFSEQGIIELAAVVGIFNYFNRFNNALDVEITI